VASSVAAGVVLAVRRGDELRHFTAEVTEGEIRDAVESTGTVNAVVNVLVGSQVSGTISRLDADFNTRVKKGDAIATIDSRLFVGTLKQAEADLESAEANVEAAAANLRRSKAMQTQTKVAFDRAKGLFAGQLVAQADVDVAEANYLTADANVDSAQAMVRQAKAQVSQKSAAVAVARTNLEYTVIRSPIDGIVVARSVDVGQTVAASLQAPTIFTIAQDLTKMLVYAKIDESDVGRIRAGRHVTFRVDSFPQDQFLGIVREIRMNPTIVQNVVTYDTVIEFDNPELKLFPGMTAYVTIPVATAEKVLKLPNAALRYKPPMAPDAVRALYAKCGIVDGEAAVRESKPNEPRAQTAIVWKLAAAGQLEPIQVTLGITDHTSTEVRSVTAGALRPGEQVVTSSVQSKTLPPGAQGIRP
jgi:HlyD family secretion protein